MRTCACVTHGRRAHAACGGGGCMARVASSQARRLWECGEFGRDQLIKHCALALPLRTGKRRAMGKPHGRPASGVSLCLSRCDCCSTKGSGPRRPGLASGLFVPGNSFTSPGKSRMAVVAQAVCVTFFLNTVCHRCCFFFRDK